MTAAHDILKVQPGQKLGLGRGLRFVCDKRNGLRFFEFRKCIRGRDFSWGVGSLNTSTVPGVKKALSQARQRAERILDSIEAGADPSSLGTLSRPGDVLTGRSPLRDVARQYVEDKGGEWSSDTHRLRWLNSLENHCSWLMNTPIADITLDAVIQSIKPHWANKTETASRMRSKLSSIFSYSIVLKLRSDDPADWKLLSQVLPSKGKIAPVQHRVAMDYQDCPELFDRLSQTEAASSRALQWIMLSACRSKEAREATWSEIDSDKRIWSLAKKRTKQRRDIRLPITSTMEQILEWARPFRRGEIVLSLSGAPLSDQAIGKQLKRYTFKDNTVHGLRTCFRVWCQETGVEDNIAEMCLGHLVGTEVQRAYARSDLLTERANVMMAWEEFLLSYRK